MPRKGGGREGGASLFGGFACGTRDGTRRELGRGRRAAPSFLLAAKQSGPRKVRVVAVVVGGLLIFFGVGSVSSGPPT